MKDSEKIKKNERTLVMSRRDFLNKVGTGALVASGLGATAVSLDFLSPNVLFEPPMRFRVGKPEDYAPDTVTLDAERKIFIVRDAQGFFTCLSAVCTHLGCLTFWKSDERLIACPCHGSRFSKHGEVLKPPAPRPLVRLRISLEDHGYLVVDKREVVNEDYILKV